MSISSPENLKIAAGEMFRVLAGGYSPPPVYGSNYQFLPGVPPFTTYAADAMLHDYQVKLAMSMLYVPVMKPQFALVGDPEICQFVEETMRKIWTGYIIDIAQAMPYTRFGAETIYTIDPRDGKSKFDKFMPFHPRDFRILTRDREIVGLRIVSSWGDFTQVGSGFTQIGQDSFSQDIFAPKSFVYIHDRRHGSFEGRSVLEGAYQPWLEKTQEGGAISSRQMWFYRCAFDSGVLFYPQGEHTDAYGNKTPWADVAAKILDSIRNGATLALENSVGADGKPAWRYEKGTISAGGDVLLQYVDHLDHKIVLGTGVPDDVITQNSGTGSYAGRTIPFIAFLESGTPTVRGITKSLKDQTLMPLVIMNFGRERGNDWDITEAKVNVDQFLGGEEANGDKGMAGDGDNDGVPNEDQMPGGGNGVPQNNPKQFSQAFVENLIHSNGVGLNDVNRNMLKNFGRHMHGDPEMKFTYEGRNRTSRMISLPIQMSHDVSSQKRDKQGRWAAEGAPEKQSGSVEQRKLKHKEEGVPFYHLTDLSRIHSIAEKGLQPRTARTIEEGDYGEPPAVWFARDDKFMSHGPDANIQDPVLLQGKLPHDHLEKHGIPDADLYHSPHHYAEHPVKKSGDSADWQETYYYQGKNKDAILANYGAAGSLAGIPWEHVERVKYGGKWHDKNEFLELHGDSVKQKEKESRLSFVKHLVLSGDVIRTDRNRDVFLENYPMVRDIIPDAERKDIYDPMFEWMTSVNKKRTQQSQMSHSTEDLINFGQKSFNWDESEHPRDHGKFAEKPGSKAAIPVAKKEQGKHVGWSESGVNKEIEIAKNQGFSIKKIKMSADQMKKYSDLYDFYKKQDSTDFRRIESIEKNSSEMLPVIVGGDESDWWATDGTHRLAIAAHHGVSEIPAYMKGSDEKATKKPANPSEEFERKHGPEDKPQEGKYERMKRINAEMAKKADQAVVNIPLSKRGNIDNQIDQYKKTQASEAKKTAKENREKIIADAAEANRLFAIYGDHLVEKAATKGNVPKKDIIATFAKMVKERPEYARKLMEREERETLAKRENTEQFSQSDSEPSGHWITIGCHGEGKEKSSGGAKVFIGRNGKILKGPAALKGENVGHIGKPAPRPEKEQSKLDLEKKLQSSGRLGKYVLHSSHDKELAALKDARQERSLSDAEKDRMIALDVARHHDPHEVAQQGFRPDIIKHVTAIHKKARKAGESAEKPIDHASTREGIDARRAHAKAAGKTGHHYTESEARALGSKEHIEAHSHAKQVAKEMGISTHDVLQNMEDAHKVLLEKHKPIEAAKTRARELIKLNSSQLGMIINRGGRDFSTIPDFDTNARSVAIEFPDLGLDPDDTGTSAAIFDLIREGKVAEPKLHDRQTAHLAAQWIAEAKKRKLAKSDHNDDEDTSFNFGFGKSESDSNNDDDWYNNSQSDELQFGQGILDE